MKGLFLGVLGCVASTSVFGVLTPAEVVRKGVTCIDILGSLLPAPPDAHAQGLMDLCYQYCMMDYVFDKKLQRATKKEDKDRFDKYLSEIRPRTKMILESIRWSYQMLDEEEIIKELGEMQNPQAQPGAMER